MKLKQLHMTVEAVYTGLMEDYVGLMEVYVGLMGSDLHTTFLTDQSRGGCSMLVLARCLTS